MFHTHVSRTEKQAKSCPRKAENVTESVRSTPRDARAHSAKLGDRRINPARPCFKNAGSKTGRDSDQVIVFHDFRSGGNNPPAASQSLPCIPRSAHDPLCNGQPILETFEEFQGSLEKAWLEANPNEEMSHDIMGDMVRRWVFVIVGMDSTLGKRRIAA